MTSIAALFSAALGSYERDELVAAAAGFEQVLAADPAHVEARYKLANVRKEQGDLAAAESHYLDVLRRVPDYAEALNNLGAVYDMSGRPSEAEARYRESIAQRVDLAPPYANLGRLLQSQQRHDEAAALYRRALERGLDQALFHHLLDAVSGASSARAPAGYVTATFDAFATHFDERLVGQLAYRVPRDLVDLARPGLGDRALDVLDLGCGTGLVGEALQEAGVRHGTWIGLDLSLPMLERARQRGCYDELLCVDIESWLSGAAKAGFDLVMAADVFIYLGDLDGIFRSVAACLRRGGSFVFSVETCEAGDWRLLETGRYAQSETYIARLAQLNGFTMPGRAATAIRSSVPGGLYWLARE